jgi:hypothetical protein
MHLPITWIARTTPHASHLFVTRRAGYNQGGKLVGATLQVHYEIMKLGKD